MATEGAIGRSGVLADELRFRVAARLRADQVFLFGLPAALFTLAEIEAEACGQANIFASSDRLIDGRGLIQPEQDVTEHERRGERADKDRDLLRFRRRADEETCLQILRGRAAIRRGDADDAAD